MDIRHENIELDGFYHIFNRGINGQMVFTENENYRFFFEKVKMYLVPYFEIYAYCLMPNHFHFLIQPKEQKISKDFNSSGLHAEYNFHSKQIGKLISSYTQAFNKYTNRHGQLFESPFKRIEVNDEAYLRNLVVYIHQNPLGIVERLEDYRFSSYNAILSDGFSLVNKEAISWFDTKENFIHCHKKLVVLDEF